MTLTEYNSLGNKDSFCSWLENLTEPLGSRWGGSSFKFGIFEFDPESENANKDSAGILRDDKYKWTPKYGESADAAFEKIKSIIVSIAEASSAGDYVAIDSADLGHATKWKIAFLYQDHDNPKLVALKKRSQRVKVKHRKISFGNFQTKTIGISVKKILIEVPL